MGELETLVEKYRGGDDVALEFILDALKTDLSAIIGRKRMQQADKDEAGQEAVIVLIGCIRRYDPALGSFRAYVCSTWRQMLKGIGRPALPGLETAPEPSYEESTAAADAEELLKAAPDAEIVRLYFGIGGPSHSVNQISAIMQRSPASVQAAISKSLQWMRARAGV